MRDATETHLRRAPGSVPDTVLHRRHLQTAKRQSTHLEEEQRQRERRANTHKHKKLITRRKGDVTTLARQKTKRRIEGRQQKGETGPGKMTTAFSLNHAAALSFFPATFSTTRRRRRGGGAASCAARCTQREPAAAAGRGHSPE